MFINLCYNCHIICQFGPGLVKMSRIFIILSVFLLVVNVGYAKGDIAAGKAKSATCIACHNVDGNSLMPIWPKIAGQHEEYLFRQISEFKKGESGDRYEPQMYAMTVSLSEQDIADLAAFYASQKPKLGTALEEHVTLGEKIYRGGNIETSVVACLSCHGPRGIGNKLLNYVTFFNPNTCSVIMNTFGYRETACS